MIYARTWELTFLLKNAYLFILIERDRKREVQRENPKRVCANSTEPNAGLHLKKHEIIHWAKIKSWCLADWATQAPQELTFFYWISIFFLGCTTSDVHSFKVVTEKIWEQIKLSKLNLVEFDFMNPEIADSVKIVFNPKKGICCLKI